MLEIKEIKTKKQQREFLNFPLKLYKDCPYFVPPLYGDEKKIFRPDYVYNDTCESVFFGAYEEGKLVGRISGILQRAHNEKTGERRVRFTRFDSVDSEEAAKALFGAVEDWARSKGMDTVCGPLGYSDLEREGLLIEGFEELATFEEQYNYAYYPALIEKCGYAKEVDWTERKLFYPKHPDERLKRTSDFILERYGLSFSKSKSTNDFLKKYADQFFALLDLTYSDIYGTVPFTDGMKKMLISNFKLIIDIKHVAVIVDKEGKVVCFGLCLPSIAKAVQPSRGHLTPLALVRLLKAIKRPEVIDMALVGVAPEYAKKGVSTAFVVKIIEMLSDKRVKYAETNLNLEDNYAIQNQWKRLDSVLHKRRRAYIKKLKTLE